MKPLTKLWNQITDSLIELGENDIFTKELYNKFDEIFNLKDVDEFKNATKADYYTADMYMSTSHAMKRAFVEGYLLSQMEQRQENIKSLLKCCNMENKNG